MNFGLGILQLARPWMFFSPFLSILIYIFLCSKIRTRMHTQIDSKLDICLSAMYLLAYILYNITFVYVRNSETKFEEDVPLFQGKSLKPRVEL